MKFIYTNDYSDYTYVLEKKIVDCHCKHVMSLESVKAQEVYNESKNIGYNHVIWGYGSGLYKNIDSNRTVQLHTIGRMIYKGFNRQFRVVIDKYNTIWVDNLHSAIRDILIFGEDITFGETKCYIVDMRNEIPIVVDVDNTVSNNIIDIEGCIKASQERCERTSKKLQEINYTIREFMEDNDITKNTLNIDEKYFNEYATGQEMR